MVMVMVLDLDGVRNTASSKLFVLPFFVALFSLSLFFFFSFPIMVRIMYVNQVHVYYNLEYIDDLSVVKLLLLPADATVSFFLLSLLLSPSFYSSFV